MQLNVTFQENDDNFGASLNQNDNDLNVAVGDQVIIVSSKVDDVQVKDKTGQASVVTNKIALIDLTLYALEADIHTHSNKSILDGITSTLIANWNAKSVVSGSNDGTNWTQITIDGVSKAIPQGGGGGGSSVKEQVYTYYYNPEDGQTIQHAITNGKRNCIEVVIDDGMIRGMAPQFQLNGISDTTYTTETEVDLWMPQDEDYSGTGCCIQTTLPASAQIRSIMYNHTGTISVSVSSGTTLYGQTGDPYSGCFGWVHVKFFMLHDKRMIEMTRWLA